VQANTPAAKAVVIAVMLAVLVGLTFFFSWLFDESLAAAAVQVGIGGGCGLAAVTILASRRGKKDGV
jgi:hypothetical protein